MIIKKYGIELHRLSIDDIELVRQKRNDKVIREKMFYQKNISIEEQREWFKSINNIYNYYFVIKYEGRKIGLIHGKVLSYKEKIAEGGIFIWDSDYLNTYIPVIVSICMTDITFLIIKMEKTIADVRTDNKVAINHNLKLGYKIIQKFEKEKRLRIELNKDDYFKKASVVRNFVKKISGDSSDIGWCDIQLHKLDYEKKYNGYPRYLQDEFDKKLNIIPE